MARVLELGGSLIVTDIDVTLGEGESKTTFKGHAMREARYSSIWHIEVLEPKLAEKSPEATFAEKVIEATAVYEAAVFDARKKLEREVKEATEALAQQQRETVAKPALLTEG